MRRSLLTFLPILFSSLFPFSLLSNQRRFCNFSKNYLNHFKPPIQNHISAYLFRLICLFRPSFLSSFFTQTSHRIFPLLSIRYFSSFYLGSIVIQPLSLSPSTPLILPLCRPLVHASTHPRIPNESTLCLPSFIGTLIIALVIAWFRLHYFEERLLSRMLPNCLRSLPFMMHGFNNSVFIDRLRFIADHRHVVVHVVGSFKTNLIDRPSLNRDPYARFLRVKIR